MTTVRSSASLVSSDACQADPTRSSAAGTGSHPAARPRSSTARAAPARCVRALWPDPGGRWGGPPRDRRERGRGQDRQRHASIRRRSAGLASPPRGAGGDPARIGGIAGIGRAGLRRGSAVRRRSPATSQVRPPGLNPDPPPGRTRRQTARPTARYWSPCRVSRIGSGRGRTVVSGSVVAPPTRRRRLPTSSPSTPRNRPRSLAWRHESPTSGSRTTVQSTLTGPPCGCRRCGRPGTWFRPRASPASSRRPAGRPSSSPGCGGELA